MAQDPRRRIACLLFYYWYYRERMFEAGRWLQLGHDILQGGDPVDFFLARIGLATALALQRRVDLARPCIERSSRFDRLCDGIVTVWGA